MDKIDVFKRVNMFYILQIHFVFYVRFYNLEISELCHYANKQLGYQSFSSVPRIRDINR